MLAPTTLDSTDADSAAKAVPTSRCIAFVSENASSFVCEALGAGGEGEGRGWRRMALAAARKRQTVPKLSDDDCLGMEAKLQQLRQSLALEKAARSKLEAKLYVPAADGTHADLFSFDV